MAEKKEPPETKTVKMTDERLVDFVGKRKLLKESFIDDATGTITLRMDFRNGETRSYVLNPKLLHKFAAHGAEQKYGDETAGMDDEDDMVLATDELHDRLTKGEWTQRREGTGLAGTSILARALVEFSGKPIERIREYLSTKSQIEKAALRVAPGIQPIVVRLEQEKAAAGTKVDIAPLIDELVAAG